MNDRDFLTIRGQRIRRTTAVRDWLCGTCGSCLVTRWAPDGWLTVCSNDADHDPQAFVHYGTWEYLEHRRQIDAANAQDVFAHLPPELQAAITE